MLLINVLLPITVSGLIVVPQPIGSYGVSLTDFEFVDTSRPDPYSDSPERTVPISFITPTGPSSQCQPAQQMYMPDPTAEYWEQYFSSTYGVPLNNTISQVALSLCKPTSRNETYPLILFSPGLGISRQFYNIIASNIAAQGFTVVTIDVPGQANFLTYFDGSIQLGDPNITTDEQLTSAVNVRVQDIQFILDSLSSEGPHPWHSICNLDTTSAAIFGHSLGSAAALSTVIADDRFLGACNLDGSFYGTPLTHTTEKPFLLFTSDDPLYPHNQSTVPSWAIVWPKLLGPKWQLQMLNSTHGTYTDIPILGSLFGLYSVPGVDAILGSIAPKEALNIQLSVLSTFAKYLFGQEVVGSVLEVATRFSEVLVVNTTNTYLDLDL